MTIVFVAESYAGAYRLEYLSNGWSLFYHNGRGIGAWNGRGGVYSAAKHFGL